MESKTPGLDALKNLNRKLTVLLENPQPGILSWRFALSETLIEMADYAGYGRVSEMVPRRIAEKFAEGFRRLR